MTFQGLQGQNRAFYLELDELLEDGFHGEIIVRCDHGRVAKYLVSDVRTPRSGVVDLTEASERLTRRTG